MFTKKSNIIVCYNHIDEYVDQQITLVLTVCDNAKEICPVFPKQTYFIHHSFDDPANATGTYDQKIGVYKKIRDQIHNFLKSEFLPMINNKI